MNIFPDVIMNEMNSPTPRVFMAVEILYKNNPVRCHTGVGEFVIDGHTYTGVGDLGGIEPIASSSETAPGKVRLSISGLDPTLVANVLNERAQGSPARVLICAYKTIDYRDPYKEMMENNDLYRIENNRLDINVSQILGDSNQAVRRMETAKSNDLPLDIYDDYQVTASSEVFIGRVSTQALEYGESVSIMVELVDEFSIFSRIGSRRYDDISHQTEYNGDRFFSLTGITSGLPIYWGSKKDAPGIRQG